MDTDSKYLFIYGTLRQADNEFGAYLRQHSRHYASGYFNGRLFDMGEYPGAIHIPDSKQKVFGEIMALDNPAKVLRLIDQYEGYGPGERQPYLYVRQIVSVTTDKGIIDCWVYLYNLPLDGFKEIINGKYQG